MRSIVITLCVLFGFSSAARAQEWNGIRLLESTCDEVKRGLGVDKCNYPESVYQFPKEPVVEFYFGSYTNQFCRCAWFLSLDLANRRGRLFRRPAVLDLTNVEVSETGRVTFRTKMDLGNVIYRFEGNQGPDGITGRFDSIASEVNADETPITTEPVLLEKVNLPVQKPQSRDFSGIYSNVRYVEKSGDLVGEELILFWRGSEPRGIFLMYEGEQMDPLAISDVSLSGPNLKFRVLTMGAELSYQGTFSRNRLLLRRTDANANPNFSRMTLFKKGSVRSVFEKPTRSTR